MEDQSKEWEIEDYSEGSNSKVSWILDKGMKLGRKIVITGIVISSAPLVLPPLVVISALGFAFSIPSGIVFASYACTEKLMSKLLPRPPSPLTLENGRVSKEEQEEEPMEDVEERVKEEGYEEDVGEYLGTKEDVYGRKGIDKNVEEPRDDADESVKEEVYEEDVGKYLEREDVVPLEVVDVKIEGMREKEAEEQVIERGKVEQPLEEVHEVVVAVEGNEKNGSNFSVPENFDPAARGVVESEFDKEVEDKRTSGEKNLTSVEELEKPFENESVNLEKLNGEMKGTGGDSRHEGPIKNEIEGRRNEQNAAAVSREVEQVAEMGENENTADRLELPVSVEEHELKRAKIDSEMQTTMPAKKELLSEEKMWEQIGALRMIVGYKAAPHATCIEELKALYIFTGVEPPASFKNPSDLVEVDDKLQFLKSIVGVK